jgi:hypothetical protein
MEHYGIEGDSNPKPLGSFHDFSSVQVACEGLGGSASLGSLKVPPSWPTADPPFEQVSPPDVATSDSVAPADAEGRPPGLTYQEGLMGMITGRCALAHATDHNEGEEMAARR